MHNGGFLAAAVVDRPAHDHSAHAHHAVNLLPNGSFEELRDGRPAGWTGRTFTGQANHEPAESGRTGDRAILIRSSGGADAAWSTQVTVKPHTRYRLSGWIKTQELRTGPGGHGVLLNAHELQPADLSRTRGLKGTEDWTHVETILDSTERTSLTIHCLFGGPGMAAGTAWFDDVSLVEVGPAHPGGAGVEHVLSLVERHVSHRLGAATAAVEDTVEGDTLVLKLATIPGLMRYDRATLTVRAGQKVRLVFDNNDVMQHNFLLLKPGSIEKVGLAADQMITDPQAMSKNFVPDLPEILAATPLVNPQEKAVLEFTAPTVPGPYPYVCTFPGHWRIMQGVLTVEAAP
jgi:azurin